MSLNDQFNEAKAKSVNLPGQSNDSKLELYSLYKQSTEGDVQGKRPGMFDMINAAKFDAWEKSKGVSKEEAMQSYIDLVNKLGS